jgi:hypothetical protein
MNATEIAKRALLFIEEGREMAAAAVDRLETSDLETSNTLVHELERALGAVETGHQILHSIMVLVSAQHQASTLPSERAKNE